MNPGTLGPFGYRVRHPFGWGDADDVSRRRCALRCWLRASRSACSASRGRSLRTSDVPVVRRPPPACALGRAGDRGRFTSPLVKASTLPRPGTPPFSTSSDLRPREAHATRVNPCRRSLDDTRNGATRIMTKSLPASSGTSRSSRLGADESLLRATCVRPPEGGSATRCHGGGAPLHASCETTTRVGARARAQLRAVPASCMAPSLDVATPRSRGHVELQARRPVAVPPRARTREGGFSTTRPNTGREPTSRGWPRVKRRLGEPRLDLSRTPLVTHSVALERVLDARDIVGTRCARHPVNGGREGRRPPRSAERPRSCMRGSTASSSRPAKGAILATIEVPSVRPTRTARLLPRRLASVTPPPRPRPSRRRASGSGRERDLRLWGPRHGALV